MAQHELIGAQVTGVRQMTNEEHTKLFGFPSSPISTATVIELTLKTNENVGLLAFADEEGNGPGSFIMIGSAGETFYADHWVTNKKGE